MRRILPGKCLPALVFLVIASALAARAATPAPFTIEGLGKATVALDGDWQFHLGDDPSWVSPALDDSGWEHLGADKPWGQQTHFGYTGYAWYRRHLNFVPGAAVDSDLALLLPRIDNTYEVYLEWNSDRASGQVSAAPGLVSPTPAPDIRIGETGGRCARLPGVEGSLSIRR